MAPVLRKLGRYQEADDHLKRSLELAERHAPPHRWEVHLARSNNFYEWSVHLEKKRPDEARERAGEAEREARAGLALAPEEPELHLNLGSTLMRRRLLESPPGPTLLEEAIREFDTALALAGKLGDKKKVREANRAQTALCDAFLGLGDVERAMPYCRQGVVVVPGDPVSHYNLAGALALSGKKDEAFAALEKDFELGDFEYEYLAADRWFESLKGDPRFKDLLGRMKARAKSKAED
jgi:tetratricopeptide (TPR) repeat protein